MKHIKIFEEHRYWIPGSFIYTKSFYINKDNKNYFYNIVKELEDNNIEYKLFYIISPQELAYVKIQAFPILRNDPNLYLQEKIFLGMSFVKVDKEEEKILNEKWTEMSSKEDIDMILNSKKYNL